ncbi:hypothetical protein J4227_01445 [Candidatus Woesearchaeota archaeon]|nr:hypothetical protein [Candidatus Woesearchaeota archaeon]
MKPFSRAKNVKNAACLFIVAIAIIIAASPVQARPETVRIMTFHYQSASDAGASLVLSSQTTRLGYYPDYRIQPKQGYSLKILGQNDNELFGIKFISPAKIYLHEYNEDEISGGLTILTENDFALTLPTYPDEEKVVILNEEGLQIYSYDVPAKENGQKVARYAVWVLLIAVIFLIFLAARRIRKLKGNMNN